MIKIDDKASQRNSRVYTEKNNQELNTEQVHSVGSRPVAGEAEDKTRTKYTR